MDKGRLEAFSDGVFAVAITLLALDLKVSGPHLAHRLAGEWPAFAAFVISFMAIGIIWVNHHMLFQNFSDIDRTLLFLNLLLLFFVVTIPFATSTMAAYLRRGGFDASLAAVIYQAAFEGMSISFGLLFWMAIRHQHMKVPLTRQQARQATIRFGLGNLGYIVGIGLAFVSPVGSLALSGLVAVYYIFEQTPRRRLKPAAESESPPESPADSPADSPDESAPDGPPVRPPEDEPAG